MVAPELVPAPRIEQTGHSEALRAADPAYPCGPRNPDRPGSGPSPPCLYGRASNALRGRRMPDRGDGAPGAGHGERKARLDGDGDRAGGPGPQPFRDKIRDLVGRSERLFLPAARRQGRYTAVSSPAGSAVAAGPCHIVTGGPGRGFARWRTFVRRQLDLNAAVTRCVVLSRGSPQRRRLLGKREFPPTTIRSGCWLWPAANARWRNASRRNRSRRRRGNRVVRSSRGFDPRLLAPLVSPSSRSRGRPRRSRPYRPMQPTEPLARPPRSPPIAAGMALALYRQATRDRLRASRSQGSAAEGQAASPAQPEEDSCGWPERSHSAPGVPYRCASRNPGASLRTLAARTGGCAGRRTGNRDLPAGTRGLVARRSGYASVGSGPLIAIGMGIVDHDGGHGSVGIDRRRGLRSGSAGYAVSGERSLKTWATGSAETCGCSPPVFAPAGK